MSGFFRKLFRRPKYTTARAPILSAPTPVVQISSLDTSATNASAPIPYNPELTGSLQADHQELLELHTGIQQAARDGDCKTLDIKIRDFETGLKAHLGEEFRNIYVLAEYLANRYDLKQDRIQLLEFKQEMQIIGGQVMGILNKYNKEAVTESQLSEIIADFNQMGGILADRIRREEATLYPMYDDYGIRYSDSAANEIKHQLTAALSTG